MKLVIGIVLISGGQHLMWGSGNPLAGLAGFVAGVVLVALHLDSIGAGEWQRRKPAKPWKVKAWQAALVVASLAALVLSSIQL